MDDLPITPDLKVARLLDAYPQVEEPLIARVPAFAKLRNPILRRTVARVTSIAQAARIAGVSARDLVLWLRGLVGQRGEDRAEDGGVAAGEPTASVEPSAAVPGAGCAGPRGRCGAGVPVADPSVVGLWPVDARVVETVDAGPLLEAGEFPLERVRAAAQRLAAGEGVLVLSPFEPVPLVDALRAGGYRCATRRVGPDAFETLVVKA